MVKSSEALHTALEGAAYLAEVEVEIPAAWPSQACGEAVPSREVAGGGAADILVGGPGPLHHHYPHTQQSGGCGVPGDFIHLPHTFLHNITKQEAQTFVHLWAKYRYGVFDQAGQTGSSLYPSWYQRGGRLEPVVTRPASGSAAWRWETSSGVECDPSREPRTCRAVWTDSEAGPACSLGAGLPTASRYCNTSEAALLPTQHNVLCAGRPARQVIAQHSDFRRAGTVRQPASLEPVVRLVRRPMARWVLAIESSQAVSPHWAWVRKAAHKFIRADLPVNSQLALLTFSSDVRVEHGLVSLTSGAVRGAVADSLPGRYHLARPGPACLACLLRAATNTGASHLLLLAGPPHNTSRAGEEAAVRVARQAGLTVTILQLPGSRTPAPAAMAQYDKLAQTTGGRSTRLPASQHGVDLLAGLTAGLSQALRDAGAQSRETVVTREHYSDRASRGEFVIDESLGRDTVFGIFVEDEEDHLIKSVTFTDSDGNQYGPFTKMSSALDPFNIKTINYVGEEPPFGNVSIRTALHCSLLSNTRSS